MARRFKPIAKFAKNVLRTASDKLEQGAARRFPGWYGRWSHWLDTARQSAWDRSVKREMARDGEAGLDDYTRRVKALHRKLRVPRDYTLRGLAFHREASELVSAPCGRDGKQHSMTPATLARWLAMQAAAAEDGIPILVASAFRSVDDQAQLIRRQLRYCDSGIEGLLGWIAAPGYSEHHTGEALDFECIPADTAFENTPTFEWLCRNAGKFGFSLSYPPGNGYGVIYEPWHWRCHAGRESAAPAGPVGGGQDLKT